MTRRPWSAEEDKTLRELAGKAPAEEIGRILGRPKGGVHHRINRLGLDGRLRGAHHWNAKVTALQSAMIGALYDAGFTVNEIHEALSRPLPIALNTLNDITACRTWRGV